MWISFEKQKPVKNGIYTVNTSDGENQQMYYRAETKLHQWYHPAKDGSEPVSGWIHNEHVVWFWDPNATQETA